jgi:hypothetical protein
MAKHLAFAAVAGSLRKTPRPTTVHFVLDCLSYCSWDVGVAKRSSELVVLILMQLVTRVGWNTENIYQRECQAS